IVIARQQIHRHRDLRHRLARLAHRAPIDLIALENVAGDDDELTPFCARDAPEVAHALEPRRAPARLCIGVEEMARDAELPIAGVEETEGHAEVSDKGATNCVGRAAGAPGGMRGALAAQPTMLSMAASGRSGK